jgi:CubicO group peptidase (beta-lactamase class C family)
MKSNNVNSSRNAWVAASLLLGAHAAIAQTCPEEIYGGWTTNLPVGELLRTEITATGADDAFIEVTAPTFRFIGAHDKSDQLSGFVYYSQVAYRLALPKTGDDTWSGSWSPLPIPDDVVPFDLYFDDDGEGGTGGYLYFRDQRLPSLFGLGARCDGDNVEFGEMNLGLTFTGTFNDARTVLTTEAAGLGGTVTVTWERMSEEQQAIQAGTPELPPRNAGDDAFVDRAPGRIDDGWATASPSAAGLTLEPLNAMVKAIAGGDLPLAHGVLVAKSGELVVEEYFYGFGRDTMHDMRSASKSIASTLVGLAVDRDLLPGSDARVLDFLDYESYGNWSAAKGEIELRHLMTMSSGLDANDSDRNSVANENAFQWQRGQPDWIKFAMDAPMIANPGERIIYGSANPMILAGVLEEVVDGTVESFAHEALFGPLGIHNYKIFMRPNDAGVYLGGGMHLTPRDMLKIGQLYLDGGVWNGERVLSESWISESFDKYGPLEPLDRNGNQYGYLWWHENYEVGERTIATVEARGHGGQYIIVVPELDAVAVLTAGNYGRGLEMTRQSQRIFLNYVLPALIVE